MVRQEKERGAWRFRKGKSRQKATYVTLYPSPSPIYSPIVPSKRGDGNGASVDSKADKPRLRKSEARRRAAMQVGKDPRDDQAAAASSPAAQFVKSWIAADGDPGLIDSIYAKIGGAWIDASRDERASMIRQLKSRIKNEKNQPTC